MAPLLTERTQARQNPCMSGTTWTLPESLRDYLLSISLREPDVMRRLRVETGALPDHMMQISAEQGQFMALLVELLGVRRAVEVGTFTGYSALAVARAMPPDGRIVACELEPRYVDIGRPYWAEAAVADRIDVRFGPAVDTLAALRAEGGDGQFDFAFIDADKPNYVHYYEGCLALLRPGGLLLVDNVLWGGAVADPDDQTESTLAIRALNAKIHADERVSVSLVPIGDGLYLVRKR